MYRIFTRFVRRISDGSAVRRDRRIALGRTRSISQVLVRAIGRIKDQNISASPEHDPICFSRRKYLLERPHRAYVSWKQLGCVRRERKVDLLIGSRRRKIEEMDPAVLH